MESGNSGGELAGLGGAAATVGTIISIFAVPYLTAGSNWAPFFAMGATLIPISLFCVFFFSGKIGQQK